MAGPAPFLPVTPLIAAHVAAGIGAVVVGAVAIFATKGSMRHRRAGLSYLTALAILALTGGILALEAWAARAHLFVLGTLAFVLALTGYAAKRRRREGWMARHLVAMGASYVVMLTAFYVDNGPRLPLWWRLPTWALWVLPSAIGAPIIGRALVRRPKG